VRRLANQALAPAFLTGAVLLGGASSAGIYANAVLQLAATLVIAGLLLKSRQRREADERGLLAILVAALLLPIVQLVPLPSALWTQLPGRDLVAETDRLVGMGPGWRPLTLSPHGTIGAALALLPVIAAALIGARVPRRGVTAMMAAIVLAAVAAVVLGMVQRATGLDSPFYLYDVTNRGYAVGPFANSNHFAVLCALALPAAAALMAVAAGQLRSRLRWAIMLAVTTTAALGIAFSSSIAGIGLAAIGLLASYLMLRRRGKTATPGRAVAMLTLGTAGLAISAAVILTLTSGGGGGGEMGRSILWARTAQAIGEGWPVGTGLGSFTAVYPRYENAQTVTGVFANHAHNDYLETVLASGIAGVALFAWFLWWFGRRSLAIWTSATPDPFARAASVMIVMIGLHECVDYPLRTAAIAVIFGLCCGVMARPPRADQTSDPSRRAGRHLSV
jgi:O-antigen ligase